MTYLLDTNVWIFGYLKPEVLPDDVQELIGRRDVQLGLSAISLWEVGKKHQIGKLELRQELSLWLKGAIASHIHAAPHAGSRGGRDGAAGFSGCAIRWTNSLWPPRASTN